MSAARHDAGLDHRLRKGGAAFGLGREGNLRDGIDRGDFLDLLNGRRAHELRILRATALDVDERSLEMDRRHLRIRHSRRGILLRVLGALHQLGMTHSERSREDRGDAFFEFRAGEFEDRLLIRIAEVVSERTVRVHIDEARHQVLTADIDDSSRRLALRDGRLALLYGHYLRSDDLNRRLGEVHIGRDHVCIDNERLFSFHTVIPPFLIKSADAPRVF